VGYFAFNNKFLTIGGWIITAFGIYMIIAHFLSSYVFIGDLNTTFQSAGVTVLKATANTVRDVIKSFKEAKMEKLTTGVNTHTITFTNQVNIGRKETGEADVWKDFEDHWIVEKACSRQFLNCLRLQELFGE